jgi:hypothetical protein
VTDARTLTALFRVPPEQFTTTRNRLVAELRRAGESPAAASGAKLPRPTPVVWAINQVTHGDRAAVERLLATADELKAAQLGRAATDVPASSKAYQEAVTTLVERSLAQLKDAGRATTAATRNRLTGTLMAAATNPALREALREARLTREHIVVGFDVFGDARPALQVVKPTRASRSGSRQDSAAPLPPPADRDATRRRADARVRLETARADLARAESQARELERTEAELARAAAEAHERATAGSRAAAQSREDVRRAKAKVTAAEKAARDQ